ncbi:MAG: hypothetical protein M3Z64_00210 [Verrucomicrobiota bacterium]|nr:hypothetical protein [Verrucomicrobiota bacterium]
MKTFEEKWTAWLDGELEGNELVEFEAALPDKAAADAEKADALKLGAFLKEQLPVAAMGNEEFFNHQLLARIERDEPEPERAQAADHVPAGWWSLGRLLWAGAGSLAMFAVCAFFVMRETNPADQSHYLTQVLNARVDPAVSPDATISMFESKEEKVTVVWVDGLQSLPSEYAAK